ncbi:MAG: hypothetical protein ACU83N_12530 [Gammaproteobacteria bacterium]
MKKLSNAIEDLESLKSAHVSKAKLMLTAFNNIMYPVDILAMAVLNRSIDLLQGFCLLIKEENYLSAAPLVRLQLDNLLRFQAVWLVSDPHDFVMKIMNGTPVRKLKDKQGNKMLDSFLVKELQKRKPWAERVYNATSGFVHLSEKHIFGLFEEPIESGGKFEISIGRSGEKVPIQMKIEAVSAFKEITDEILVLVDEWITTKQNPELLSVLREERYPAKA